MQVIDEQNVKSWQRLFKNRKYGIIKDNAIKLKWRLEMRKRILAVLLGIGMMASLVGCGEDTISNEMVSVKEYKGLKVESVDTVEVTDEEVNESIAYTLEVAAAEYADEYGIKDRAAEDGDTVLIDYSGKLDGVQFDGGTAEKQTLALGSNTFIDGFEEAIIGHKPGETFDIDVTFPEDYGNEELNGQAVVFTIVFHAIVPTEITDEIASILMEEEITAEEYKEQVREDLKVSNEETAEADYENEVYTAFLENCEMKKYPEDELEQWKQVMEDTYGMYASYYGMETDEFLEMYYGTTLEKLAKEQILFKYAIELVAEEEGMSLSLEDYEKAIEEQSVEFGYDSAEEYEQAYEEYYGEGYLKSFILQEKVMSWLVDNSVTAE